MGAKEIRILSHGMTRQRGRFRCFLALICFHVFASAADPEFVVLTKGTYTFSELRDVVDATAVGGKRLASGEASLASDSTRIAAAVGTAFGLEYLFRAPPGTPVLFRTIWSFPPNGLVDPETGKATFDETSNRSAIANQTVYTGWNFSFDWELVPGLWRVEIWLNDRKVHEQPFEVFLP